MPREIGQNGLDLVRHCEGVVYRAYLDSSGYLTAGVGHLVQSADNLVFGDLVSKERVDEWLQHDLATAAACVDRNCPDLAGDNARDALIDFAYNAGCANLSMLVQDGDATPEWIADHFSHYTRSGSDHPRGLRIRRALERDLFLTPDGVPLAADWLTAHDGIA